MNKSAAIFHCCACLILLMSLGFSKMKCIAVVVVVIVVELLLMKFILVDEIIVSLIWFMRTNITWRITRLVIYLSQVIGRLPFDDTNHRKLLKLIEAGPVFPPNRESSQEFQEAVMSILLKEDKRIGIPEFRKTPWYSLNAYWMLHAIILTLLNAR